jgi:nucleotidyltransferase AbiEii toxin of type IV toxin-antitoxin system
MLRGPQHERKIVGRFNTIPVRPESWSKGEHGFFSGIRVQIHTDPRYEKFLAGVTVHDVLGFQLPVASLEAILQGKIWAVLDPARRPSKRQKDLADIARLIETYPYLRPKVPGDVVTRLI